MSENTPITYEQVLIDRQSARIGHLTTQVELLLIQLEQASAVCHKFGVNIDGSPLEEVRDGRDQRDVDESASSS